MDKSTMDRIRKTMLAGTAGLALPFGGVACNDEPAGEPGVPAGEGE